MGDSMGDLLAPDPIGFTPAGWLLQVVMKMWGSRAHLRGQATFGTQSGTGPNHNVLETPDRGKILTGNKPRRCFQLKSLPLANLKCARLKSPRPDPVK